MDTSFYAMSSTCLHYFSVADTQKLSQSPVTLASDISPPQVVRKLGQTAAKMTENIANKVMKEVGEKLQSVPKSIPVWVQSGVSRIIKNDLDKNELQVKSNKMNGMSNGNGKVVDICLDESKENFKNSMDSVETERNGSMSRSSDGNMSRSSEDDASVSSTENGPVTAPDALVFNTAKSDAIREHMDSNDLGQCSEKNGFTICKTHSFVEIHSAKAPSSSVKHSSSVSEFEILHDPCRDDEIVYSRGKRSKKRHSVKGKMYSKL